ncbi:MAG: ankyrin repeat domain-containing protein [Candidatus Aminicenantes bacterium]|nr:ankyrin repeat domain-containing protein [Candidatus Aminicenantes bacterium]
MRKMRTSIFASLAVFLIAGQNSANPGNPRIPDRDLFMAIQRNNLELFQGYLAGNANWHAIDGRGNTLIHALIAPEMIELLELESPVRKVSMRVVMRTLDKTGNPVSIQMAPIAHPRVNAVRPIEMQMVQNSPGKKDDPLQMRMDIVRSLVGHGVDINQTNDRGETPLKLAVYMAKSDSQAFSHLKRFPDGWLGLEVDPALVLRFVRFLLDLGANPRLCDAKGKTPLFDATGALIPLLLKHGAVLEDRDQNGMTLFLAADPKKALALLKLGADPQATDNRKRNRWHYLDFVDWEELAQKLIELRVNINQRDLDGQTPLLLNCGTEKIKLALFLLEHGADPVLASNYGDTPLHKAASASNLELMEWLLRHGAAVNVRNRSGQTPLHYAYYNEKSAELLLRYKADPNIPDIAGNTILHILIENGGKKNHELLSFFIHHGASLYQKDGSGETPLGKALYKEDFMAMKVLLENGADPNVAGSRGWSLLDRAEINKRFDILSLLRKYGARRKRSWLDRYKQELLIGLAFLGIIPLFTFLFSLNKPAPLTKKLVWFFIAPVGLFFILLVARIRGGFFSGGEELLFFILAMPPLAALLMSLSGTRMLADRCPPWLGIPLSFLNAAGCMGLTLGIVFLFLPGTHGEGGIILAYDALFGGGAAAIITLIFAIVVWKKRLASAAKHDKA